ncbi:GNAT family N-acetyltransferase [Salinibacterium hongtaonis]|uniref:GNAT family N-acetyltransferase n=1 Tax=Homoserinimonas hongtaonis TaxID=2079791 RepID=A0A2U1T057_9MICO|nr:GNAT family N-acetyltransferase [Salinibacterium hongtaonis]PWB97261.1 GNAT family N-acetyltransferase [Salinibacterium hongtaonis]
MSQIRVAAPSDVPEILRLIGELAIYEKEPDAVVTTEDDLQRALFGTSPAVFAHVIDGDEPGTLAGICIWFLTFSTWEGVHGIHLEDLFVLPEYRGRGYGKALLTNLAAICGERGYARLEWAVLDWNEPAIGFYRSLGAEPMDEWTTFRLDGDALAGAAQLAAG